MNIQRARICFKWLTPLIPCESTAPVLDAAPPRLLLSYAIRPCMQWLQSAAEAYSERSVLPFSLCTRCCQRLIVKECAFGASQLRWRSLLFNSAGVIWTGARHFKCLGSYWRKNGTPAATGFRRRYFRESTTLSHWRILDLLMFKTLYAWIWLNQVIAACRNA